MTADEVIAYYNRTEFQHGKDLKVQWLREYIADGPKKVTDVVKEAQKQGITKKQFRNLRDRINNKK